MRKVIITVLFCLGLFVVHQWALSQDESITVPAPVVEKAVPPTLPPPAASLPGMSPAPTMGGDPRFAAEMRTQLTMQLREISQLLGRVDPRDTQFIETLRQEQALILEQLKSFEAPAAPAARTVGTMPPMPPGVMPGPMDPASMPAPPGIQRVGGDPRTPFPSNGQISQDEIAKLIAEAQQAQATRPLFNPQPQSPYTPQGMPPSFGGRTSNFGAVPSPQNFTVPPQSGLPWGTAQSSQEITELKDTIATLQQQVEQMRGEIKALETQMRLLNQNILNMMAPASR